MFYTQCPPKPNQIRFWSGHWVHYLIRLTKKKTFIHLYVCTQVKFPPVERLFIGDRTFFSKASEYYVSIRLPFINHSRGPFEFTPSAQVQQHKWSSKHFFKFSALVPQQSFLSNIFIASTLIRILIWSKKKFSYTLDCWTKYICTSTINQIVYIDHGPRRRVDLCEVESRFTMYLWSTDTDTHLVYTYRVYLLLSKHFL